MMSYGCCYGSGDEFLSVFYLYDYIDASHFVNRCISTPFFYFPCV
ncbi:unnamed protein product [Cuscuta europaea]|uniref:Uncharacterized protein n=1 Tax=Cuscuta europaea TaxID=41803 RepID=A0A9P0YYW6_CUSEU|nr:unnamed protein product [Cuscuta europaea]